MFKVYLAGAISGLTYGEGQGWREYVQSKIDPRIKCYSPLRGKDYLEKYGKLEGSYEEFPLSTAKGITTRDRFDCMGSDLVIVNLLNAPKVSIGTMIELGWADAARNPVVLVMDKGNIHEHPMVDATTGYRVSTIDDAIALTEMVLLEKKG